MKSIFKIAGINATAHDLRDSFVSHLIYLGYPIEDVSKITGHSSTKVTEYYYYKQLEERQREMQTDLGCHITKRLPVKGIENGGKNVARKRGKKAPPDAQS